MKVRKNRIHNMKKFYIPLLSLAMILTPVALKASDQGEVIQAAHIINDFNDLPEKRIPRFIMRDAKGLAILTVLKAGFIFSGKGGEGIVVARTKTGWSGPSFIKTGGVGFGAQIGGEVTEFVIVLEDVVYLVDRLVTAVANEGNVLLHLLCEDKVSGCHGVPDVQINGSECTRCRAAAGSFQWQ